jgi:hypothetical protein
MVASPETVVSCMVGIGACTSRVIVPETVSKLAVRPLRSTAVMSPEIVFAAKDSLIRSASMEPETVPASTSARRARVRSPFTPLIRTRSSMPDTTVVTETTSIATSQSFGTATDRSAAVRMPRPVIQPIGPGQRKGQSR